jgi:uncharacterized protein YeeX (DUF496 family)
MKKLFAMANVDNSFIVSASSEEELTRKLENIREKYEKYYHDYVIPGFYVVKAKNLMEAKTKKKISVN